MWINVPGDDLKIALCHLRSCGPAAEAIAKRIEESVANRKDPQLAEYVGAAIELFAKDGELEVDDDAVVSKGGDAGAYVMCWRWVSDEDAGVKPEKAGG